MARLTDDELKKELIKMFKELQSNQLMPKEIDLGPNSMGDKMIDNVVKNIQNTSGIQKEDLRNANVAKTLKMSLISEYVNQVAPEMKVDYKILFKNNRDANGDDIKNELKKELTKLFTALNELNPKLQLSKKGIDELADTYAEELKNDFMKNEDDLTCLAQSDKSADVFSEMMTPFAMSLRSLFGGVDPRYPGGQIMAVPTVQNNLTGIVETGGHETALTVIDELNSYQGKADPNGIENSVRRRLDAISPTLETDLTAEGEENAQHIKPKNPTSTNPFK